MKRIVAIALGAILVVACSGPPGNTAALPGTAWTVATIGGEATVAATPPTMTFGADGVVSGTTGCNTYTGSYKVDGSSITIGPLAMTLILCQGPVAIQETAFSLALQKSTAWDVGSNGSLTLTGSAGIVATPVSGG